MSIRLVGIQYLGNSFNSGKCYETQWLERRPRYRKFFQYEGSKVFSFTDLDSTIRNRKNRLRNFFASQLPAFLKRKISIVSAVFYAKAYSRPSKMMRFIRDKLKRHKIKLINFFWQKDVGSEKFESHFHILLSITRISTKTLRIVFSNPSKAKAQFIRTRYGMYKYLCKKPVYCEPKGRSFGGSIFRKNKPRSI